LTGLSINKAAKWQPFYCLAEAEQDVSYGCRPCLFLDIAITFSGA
jgi:hypothetical protein